MAGRLEGKVAFITGIGRGQGRSHAVRLAAEGADIIGVDALADHDSIPYAMASQDDLDETVRLVETRDRRIIAHRADVRDREALTAVLDDSVGQLGGRLDIVAANAGVSPRGGPLWELTSQEWDEVIGINLGGVFNTLAASIPVMLAAGNGGSIVVTSSGAALRHPAGLADRAARIRRSSEGEGVREDSRRESPARDGRDRGAGPGHDGRFHVGCIDPRSLRWPATT